MDQGHLPLLGRGVRLARARSEAQSLYAVHDRYRRSRRSLPACPFAASGRDAADHHPWLAGLGGRVPQGDRALDRPDRAWRQRSRRVPRRLPILARFRFFGEACNYRLGYRSYRVELGGVDGSSWIFPLRRAGRRLGSRDHDRPRRARPRALCRHPHHARDVRAAQCGRRADAGGDAGAEGNQILRRLGFRLFQAAIDQTANPRLRPDGLAERTGGVDIGEVLGLDRLRRAPGEHSGPRRTARQCHALLGDGDSGFVRAALLGELCAQAPHAPQGVGTDGRGRLPEGNRYAGAGNGWSRATPTSGTGAKCRRAAILPRSSSPNSMSGKSGISSERSGSRRFPDRFVASRSHPARKTSRARAIRRIKDTRQELP